jgi:hypothetical protein
MVVIWVGEKQAEVRPVSVSGCYTSSQQTMSNQLFLD